MKKNNQDGKEMKKKRVKLSIHAIFILFLENIFINKFEKKKKH